MTADVRSTVNWEEFANLKPVLALKSTTSLQFKFSEASYPRPRREFKLPKREVVYNFDVTKFKRRYLRGENTSFSTLRPSQVIVFWNDIRAVRL